MLAVVQHPDLNIKLFLKALLDCVDGAVSHPFKGLLKTVIAVRNLYQCGEIAILVLRVRDLASAEMDGLLALRVVVPELLHNLFRSHLSLFLGNGLDHIGKFLMHPFGKLEAEEGVHDKGHPAFAGLAVDPDHRLILPSDICRVDGKIGNLPVLAPPLLQRCHAFVDSILMRTGKCGKHQLSRIRVTFRDVHLGAALVHLRDGADIFDVQLRIDSLREHIISQSQNIYIACPLSVAKQGSLHPLGAG